jgi:hypothetical protein
MPIIILIQGGGLVVVGICGVVWYLREGMGWMVLLPFFFLVLGAVELNAFL